MPENDIKQYIDTIAYFLLCIFLTAFILCLLAILIAVGVGLIVHFAGSQKFECVFPEEMVQGHSSQNQKDQGKVSCRIMLKSTF